MRRNWIGAARIGVTLILGLLCLDQTAFAKSGKIIQDAEYYILDAQNGEKWKVEDNQLDAKLAELKSSSAGRRTSFT